MRVVEIDEEVYFDFILSCGGEAYEVNESFTPSDFKFYKKTLKDIGLENDTLTFRVLYFYNGGCAGLTEVV